LVPGWLLGVGLEELDDDAADVEEGEVEGFEVGGLDLEVGVPAPGGVGSSTMNVTPSMASVGASCWAFERYHACVCR
jgi:hypothetical protein